MAADHGRSRLRPFLLATAAMLAAIVLCYLAVDRPWATFSHDHLRPLGLLLWATDFNLVVQPIMTVLMFGMGVFALRGRRLTKLQSLLLLTPVVYLVVRGMKDDIQSFFGRTWPEPWVEGGQSYIGDGTYGFTWLDYGEGYASFPSGTAATVCAAVAVAWFWYPRWRVLYAIPVAVVMFAMLASDFHFVSDVIGGAYLGFATGWIAAVVWEQQLGWRAVPEPVGQPSAVGVSAAAVDTAGTGAAARAELSDRD